MKKIFAYFGLMLSIALVGVFTACNPTEIDDQAEAGLGIKVFFPTKVVAGQPMTISGTGMADVKEVVFPTGVTVTAIEHVGNGMIRVTAPAGIAAGGGKLIVRSADDEAESSQDLTLGHTVVSGFSKQDGEEIGGGEQLTVFGTDLEFISGCELLDPDGNPLILNDEDFYRKGTSTVIITIPKKIFEGTWTGKLFTFDGREIPFPELTYTPATDGGHWETVETILWQNELGKAVSWSGDYRFAVEGRETGEEIYAFPQDIWNKLKSETFYLTVTVTDPQIRVTTGWWSGSWEDKDFQPGNDERLVDNGDGTFTLEINLSNASFLELMDEQHLLFTGDRYTPVKIFFKEDVWVDGGGHMEIVKTSLWKNELGKAVSWSGDYRFAVEGRETGEEIYAFPQDIWDKLKSETFYLDLTATDPQVRVTTGWWSGSWCDKDFQPGNDDRLVDNGDGTWTLEINLSDASFLELMDEQHLLFTGDRYTPIEIYFKEEVWVDGGDGGPKETVFWQNDGGPAVSWSGTYRYAVEGRETGEEIAAFPQDIWDKLKSKTFYLMVTATDPQIRVTTGWWSGSWEDKDFQPGNDERLVDNGDGTWTLEINLSNASFLDLMDEQHLLFTGDRFTPVKLFFLE